MELILDRVARFQAVRPARSISEGYDPSSGEDLGRGACYRIGKRKGQITLALSIVSAWKKTMLDAELAAQSLKTNQDTAQQHECLATVGY